MVLLFARNTSDRVSVKKSDECKLKRHFSCRLMKLDQLKSFDTNDSKMSSSTPRHHHQTACAHRSLPRYYSNNYGKQNGGLTTISCGNGNGGVAVYSSTTSSSSSMSGGHHHPQLLACDDSYLSTTSGVRKSDHGDSSSMMEGYELSTDFQQKHLEMLERKYGGRIRARRAAVVIQRAFRKYRLEKKFENLRLVAVDGNRRRSGGRSRVILNRFHSSASVPNAQVAQNQRFLVLPTTQQQMQQQQQFFHHQRQYTASKKVITTTKSEGRLMTTADGQWARVIVGNPPASLSVSTTNKDNGGAATKLKLHRYNIDEETPRGSVLHSKVANQDEHGQKYRPPAVNILRNRSVSVERTAVLNGATNMSVAKKTPVVTQQHSFPENAQPQRLTTRTAVHHFPNSSTTPRSEVLNSTTTTTTSSSSSTAPPAVRRVDSDQTTPVWLPMAVAAEHGSHQQQHQKTKIESNTSLVEAPPQQQAPVLSRSLPESQWLRHWGRRSLISVPHRQSELERKRQYRIALNFFNKKPERGVQFLVDFGFVEGKPSAVAKLLISRKGLSKQMIGEYLGNLLNPFNMAVLECFANEVDMTGMDLDVALRRFQSLFRLPGEAQKIERIMEVFARRYCECNADVVKQFRQADTIFLLAFAIIMLNTDLHSPNIKPERRMKVEDFMKNLRGIDGGSDVNAKLLTGIYHRVKEQEFKPGSDHVTQVLKVDRSIVGKKPTLALPHRRLVCYCRLYEVMDPQKKQAANVHQREIFLFNDMILITKILSRKKNSVTTYTFRSCHTLVGMQVQPFKNQHYANGLRINHTLENKTFFFNARSEEDRTKFMEDLKESICESDEMEALRIELELEKQNKFCSGASLVSTSHRSHSLGRGEQRDSGLPELDDPTTASSVAPKNPCASQAVAGVSTEARGPDGAAAASRARDTKPRCASLTSLDSGMSSTASTVSRESSPKNSRPPTTSSSLQNTQSTPTTSTENNSGGASSSTSSLGQPPQPQPQPRQVRAFSSDVRHRRRSGSMTPPPEVTFFTESSEV